MLATIQRVLKAASHCIKNFDAIDGLGQNCWHTGPYAHAGGWASRAWSRRCREPNWSVRDDKVQMHLPGARYGKYLTLHLNSDMRTKAAI